MRETCVDGPVPRPAPSSVTQVPRASSFPLRFWRHKSVRAWCHQMFKPPNPTSPHPQSSPHIPDRLPVHLFLQGRNLLGAATRALWPSAVPFLLLYSCIRSWVRMIYLPTPQCTGSLLVLWGQVYELGPWWIHRGKCCLWDHLAAGQPALLIFLSLQTRFLQAPCLLATCFSYGCLVPSLSPSCLLQLVL